MKFINYILESSKNNYIGLFLGRFQGLTNAHIRIIDTMSVTHPHSYVVLVKGDKSSLDVKHNPLPFEIQKRMIEKILPDNVELTTAKSANLEDILPGMEGKSFIVYAGTDRTQDYRKYASYVDKQGYKVKVVEVARTAEDISASKLRLSVKNNDFETFKTLTPRKIWNMFNELQEYIK